MHEHGNTTSSANRTLSSMYVAGNRILNRAFLSNALLVVLGIVLIVASLLKAHELSQTLIIRLSFFMSLAVVAVEAIVGVLLITRATDRAWTLAIAFFFFLACISLSSILLDRKDCGCFGKWRVAPQISFSFNITAIGLLLLCQASAKNLQHRPLVKFAAISVVGTSMVVGALLIVGAYLLGPTWRRSFGDFSIRPNSNSAEVHQDDGEYINGALFEVARWGLLWVQNRDFDRKISSWTDLAASCRNSGLTTNEISVQQFESVPPPLAIMQFDDHRFVVIAKNWDANTEDFDFLAFGITSKNVAQRIGLKEVTKLRPKKILVQNDFQETPFAVKEFKVAFDKIVSITSKSMELSDGFAEFKITNSGNEIVTCEKLSGSCGCQSFYPATKFSIPPHETRTIGCRFSASKARESLHHVFVELSDSQLKNSEIELMIFVH